MLQKLLNLFKTKERCRYCGNKISDFLTAWHGGLYCSKECVNKHIKSMGLDDQLLFDIEVIHEDDLK